SRSAQRQRFTVPDRDQYSRHLFSRYSCDYYHFSLVRRFATAEMYRGRSFAGAHRSVDRPGTLLYVLPASVTAADPGQACRVATAITNGAHMTSHRIAVIAGDGIGKEVMPPGQRAVEAACAAVGASVNWTPFDWSCETYKTTGRMMPEDGLDRLADFDAIFLG